MLTHSNVRPCLVVVVVMGVLGAVATTVAYSDGNADPWTGVACTAAQCQVGAGTPGRASVPAPSAQTANAPKPQGHEAAKADDQPASTAASPSPSPTDCALLAGATCFGLKTQGVNPAAPAAAGSHASPEALAQQAVRQLQLPLPVIRMNPDASAAQVVRVPTWLWVDRGVWRPVSKTVQVPGVTVTATATPQQVIWSMGDGGSVSCAGPGTPYSAAYPADASSPDCGYTYVRSSAGQPGEAFTVTATVVWTAVWHGGGRGGTVPGLRSRAQVLVRVSEVQGVIVSGDGAI
ncbi:hypothetical protein NGB36_28355 [Streptomyces sp. RB6PN25]|uniref:ATP/GTP-binding protein n=1 Tax=Streptomyces humicola TaxID=2953240 RepID=A0ABT1Q381_9ACTN|nr:hypothetical protein [Streptomyces humicola]MCQ4084388.1 hypothetical protein [Streptomyces humicola]